MNSNQIRMIFFALTLASKSALAAGNGTDIVPSARYKSGRALGMGDAMIGHASDAQDALFYNPSALGRIRGFRVEPLNFQLQLNKDLLNGAGAEVSNFPTLSKYSAELKNHPGGSPGGSFSLFPNVSFRGFGFGLLYQSRVRAHSDGTTLHYQNLKEFVPTAGIGLNLASGVLRLGYSVQWVHQTSGDISVPDGTSPIGYNYYNAEGSGFSHTFGSTLTLPYIYQPSFQFVGRNLGDTSLHSKSMIASAEQGTGFPATEKMSFDGGFSWLNKLGGNNESRWSVVYRDFMSSSGAPVLTRLAFGVELSFDQRIYLRGGYGSKSPSVGLGFNVRDRLSFDFAVYGEELGTVSQPDHDTRYVMHLKIHSF